LLLAVFVAAAVLRIGVVGRSSLWGDELFSLAIATGHSLEQPAAASDPRLGDFVEPDYPVPATEFQRYLKHDNPPASPARVVRAVFLSDTSPPLYYLLLYGWTLIFGTSDIALRLFSTACSLACLPFFVSIARRTGGLAAVLPACVLFAFSPLAIYYSTEGRMYSILWLCVLPAAWASLVLHQDGGSLSVLALWVVASAAGFLTHYFFLFPWLAMVAFLLICPGKFRRRRLFACLFVTGLLILPWYSLVPESFGRWRVTHGWLKLEPIGFNVWRETRNYFLQFFSARLSELMIHKRASALAALALFAVSAGLMAWRLGSRVFSERHIFLFLWFAAACVGPIVYDLINHTYMVARPRYAAAALPAAYLLVAAGFAALSVRLRVIMLGLIVLAWAPNVLNIYDSRYRSWAAFRDISSAVSAKSSASDLILIHSIPSGVLGIARYVTGPVALASWVEQLGTRRVPESLHMLTAGRSHIVFVRVHDVGAPAPEEDWLRTHAVVSDQAELGNGKIVDFQPKGAETF
jgi:hypothetical protein